MISEKRYKRLLILRSQFEHIIFRDFMKKYEMPLGLKLVHAITMIKLRYIKRLSMTELSYGLNLEKASVTKIADKLVELGYIESQRSTEDRRMYLLTLTEEGKEFADSFQHAHRRFIEKKLSDFPADNIKNLFDSIDMVTDFFEEAM